MKYPRVLFSKELDSSSFYLSYQFSSHLKKLKINLKDISLFLNNHNDLLMKCTYLYNFLNPGVNCTIPPSFLILHCSYKQYFIFFTITTGNLAKTSSKESSMLILWMSLLVIHTGSYILLHFSSNTKILCRILWVHFVPHGTLVPSLKTADIDSQRYFSPKPFTSSQYLWLLHLVILMSLIYSVFSISTATAFFHPLLAGLLDKSSKFYSRFHPSNLFSIFLPHFSFKTPNLIGTLLNIEILQWLLCFMI